MRPLDATELEALRLFANGRTSDEIAAALNVSKSLAMHYLRVAARKLGAATACMRWRSRCARVW